MKISGIFLLCFTTVVLILLTIISALNFPFSWVFYLMCFGQLIFLITVYRILTEKYTTNKTFEDLYEDYTPDSEDY